MIDFALQVMDFVFKMMSVAFKMMNFVIEHKSRCALNRPRIYSGQIEYKREEGTHAKVSFQ